MQHFADHNIVGATEFRRHLGKYLEAADEEPVLVMDGRKKKIFMDIELFEQMVAEAKPTAKALKEAKEGKNELKKGMTLRFENGKDAIHFLGNL